VRAQLADVDARIGRLTEAIQIGGALGPLVADLKTLITRREHLLVKLNGYGGERHIGVADLRALEAELYSYVDQWVSLLHQHTPQARQMLRKVIDGRILVRPGAGEAELELRYNLGRLIAGLRLPKAMVTPGGHWDGVEFEISGKAVA